ncbi:class 1 fructose-bisphosphatase [Rhizobium sp. IMFF44]|uniref:class 1 fructose-bisphosphatase n=1 Tax=Rhizobium sp. IMFF44 TaxID=3342350 RepID=UPI0035BA1E11
MTEYLFKLKTDALDHRRSSVTAYLRDWKASDAQRWQIAALIEAITRGAQALAVRIARGAVPGDLSALSGVNSDGDNQKALDVASHDLFVSLLLKAGATSVLSEEADLPVRSGRDEGYAVAIDPLDGSGNVGLGAPLGTFFSIIPQAPGVDPFTLRGNDIVAAGYVSYGNSLDMAFSVGNGLVLATFDPVDTQFVILDESAKVKPDTAELAFNASVRRYTEAGVSAYLADCMAGAEGPRGKNFNMRWVGAAVGELQRIVHRGGIFLYVGDDRPGYSSGRLRHLYEANPIAFILQQAGGAATDGAQPILSKAVASYHARTPLVFGSINEVNKLSQYILENRSRKEI